MRVARVTLLLVAVLLAALLALASAAASARHDEHASLLQAQLDEPPQRDAELMRAQLGMVELDAEADAEAETEAEAEAESESPDALMEVDAAAESASESSAEAHIVASSESRAPGAPPNFVLDEADSERVFVEASSAADEQMAAGAAASAGVSVSDSLSGPPPVPVLGAEASGPASSVAEMLPTRVAPPAGQSAPTSTFLDAPQSSARPERSRVVQRRLDRAQYGLAKKAWREHVAEYDAYRHKLHAWQWTRAVEESRQATKFQRPLHNEPAVPAASSHAAAMGGDRNHNRLFPAATLASDGKASSQNDDFQHRGHGDQFAQPILVETLAEGLAQMEAEAEQQAEQQAEQTPAPDVGMPAPVDMAAPVEGAAAAPADAAAAAAAPADAAAAAAAPVDAATAGAAPAGDAAAAAAPIAMDASAAGAAAPMDAAAAGALAPAAAAASVDGSSNSGFVPYAADKPAFVAPPNLANQPCYDQCNAPGAWVSAACQDCIVRGMVNGWIVRSLVDRQKGYNYAHYARNKCVAYVNELQAKGAEVKGAPFAHCFFQRMHETCNL